MAAGFTPSNINFVGHSHGTYAAYFASDYLMQHSNNNEKVSSIIALDSAKNPAFIGAHIREEDIQFKNVANYSLALHSSFLGSIDRSLSAQNTILVGSNHPNETSVKQHGDSANALTDLFTDLKNRNNGNVLSVFSFSPKTGLHLKVLSDAYGYDAMITIKDKASALLPDWKPIDVTGISLRTSSGDWSKLMTDLDNQPIEGVDYKPSTLIP
jgi:hypothetical protein